MIEVHNLSKHFHIRKRHSGSLAAVRNFISRETHLVKAVDELSFKIQAGQVVGYLGPNGAGKSTTLKMLTGLLVPTAGDITVNGLVPWRERTRYVARIGAVFGQRSTLWWDLPLIESLDLLKHMYKIPAQRFKANLASFDRLLELSPFLSTPVRSLSLGQRMRADLCAALMHDPELLFLDEPTIGLDVVAKERIRQFIRHINRERGTTVVLTTHDLADVQKLCQRIMIIDHGKLLFDDSLVSLQDRFAHKRQLVVDFAEVYDAPSVEGASLIAHHDRRARYAFDRRTISASELIGRLSAAFNIQDLAVEEADIEVTIRQIYEQGLAEN